MCGRFTLHSNKKALAKAIALAIPEQFEQGYNIGPGREVLAIAQGKQRATAAGMMHWGLRTPQNFHINARLETADTTPRFRDSWLNTAASFPPTDFTNGVKMVSVNSLTTSTHSAVSYSTSLASGFLQQLPMPLQIACY